MQDYAAMQIRQYEFDAANSQFTPGSMQRDDVVGSFNEQNSWSDYQEYLIRHSKLGLTQDLVALDFACGPGRNILLFSDRFMRIDGVDLGEKNLINAKIYTSILPEEKRPILYKCNGLDLADIPSSTYDIVFSTIALQHICCHAIRYGYLKEFNRILKPGGFLCVQMGFGEKYPANSSTASYFANVYDAKTGYDTRIENVADVEKDLTEVGFQDFEYNIRPSGPGDFVSPNWIFWSVVKSK